MESEDSRAGFDKQYGESIGKSTISEYVKTEGYTFRKARRVLTSPDLTYRESWKRSHEFCPICVEMRSFFHRRIRSFSVKMQGGWL